MRQYVVILFTCLAVTSSGPDAAAQEVTVPDTSRELQDVSGQRRDVRLLLDIYNIDQPPFNKYMRTIDFTTYPVFVGGPLALWGVQWLGEGGDETSVAYRMVLSELAGGVAFFSLKRVFKRPRPHSILENVEFRRKAGGKEARYNTYDFPSGHATLAFAQAMTLSLSYPRWYVIVPSFIWASSVGVSRVWLGMHFPSSVAAGAALGMAVATGVYLVRGYITPAFIENRSDDEHSAPALSFHVRF